MKRQRKINVGEELQDIYNANARFAERLDSIQSDNLIMHAELIAAMGRLLEEFRKCVSVPESNSQTEASSSGTM